MAKFNARAKPKPIEIDEFLGLNESVGETEIKLGEAVALKNFRITNNYKAQSRPGQNTLWDYSKFAYHELIAGDLILYFSGAVNDLIKIPKSAFTGVVDFEYELQDSFKIDGFATEFSPATDWDNDTSYVGKYSTTVTDELWLVVASGTYANLAAAQADLAGTVVWYELATPAAGTDINGLWYGTVASKEVLISINDGKVYEYVYSTEVNTQIGTITDAPCKIFWFESKIYFLNGTDYKEYDGTTYQDVVGYVPIITIGTPPAGGGTLFEEENLLSGKKTQRFVADGATATYVLAETNIDADLVLVDDEGVTVVENVGFTVNRTAVGGATIDFSAGSAPHGAPTPSGAQVDITYTKVVAGNADLVKNNRGAVDFGPGNDTAVFIWGDEDNKNVRRWSGTLDASYWPVNNNTVIGTDEFPITDIVIQYDRQIIMKQDRTFYSRSEFVSTTETYEYPVFDLNERLGNVAFGQSQIVENNPISLSAQSMWRWSNTQVEDERNASIISEKIRKSLETLDLTTAITFDYEKEKEYWLNVGNNVYIWNYGNDTFYIYDNIAANNFVKGDDTIYYGGAGKVIEINSAYIDDDGDAIENRQELGFTDFGVNHLNKNSRKMWLTIEPASRTSVSIYWQTSTKSQTIDDAKTFPFSLMDYGVVDYGDWSYQTNRNPQPKKFKIRAKKYPYIKLIFVNSEVDETLTILSLKVQAETTGEVK